MTIENLIVGGGAAGLLTGLFASSRKLGCALLCAIPIMMIGYVIVWQHQHPESLRSTSALDFIFGPLWPSIGGIAGFCIGRLVRAFTFNGAKGD